MNATPTLSTAIFNPLEEYQSKFEQVHRENIQSFFDELVTRSGVDIEKNRKTVKEYNESQDSASKLKKKLNLFRFLRVLMCITIILIPLVILKMTPCIRELREQVKHIDQITTQLYEEACAQMRPLNELFTSQDALRLFEKTIPQVTFAPCFTSTQEEDMVQNYDFIAQGDLQSSSDEVLAGEYNGNPFLFQILHTHRMGMETYHGYKTIRWTETYRDSNGRTQRRTRTQTLHATLVKPKPFYGKKTVLYYGAQGAPDLSFSRDAEHLEQKSEKQLERMVKKEEKLLKKKKT